MSHKSNNCDEFMLSYEISFYLSNSFDEIENDDFKFDKVIKNSEVISYEFSQAIFKEFNNIRNSLFSYNADEYIIEQTLKKFRKNRNRHLLIHIFL